MEVRLLSLVPVQSATELRDIFLNMTKATESIKQTYIGEDSYVISSRLEHLL